MLLPSRGWWLVVLIVGEMGEAGLVSLCSLDEAEYRNGAALGLDLTSRFLSRQFGATALGGGTTLDDVNLDRPFKGDSISTKGGGLERSTTLPSVLLVCGKEELQES